jgi:uncharacterized protein (TIGR02118 family)
MPKLIVLYPPPADAVVFERRYRLEHAPMVLEKVPGMTKFVACHVLGTPSGAAPYQRVAELYFDSLETLQAAMASPGARRRWHMPWRSPQADRRSS